MVAFLEKPVTLRACMELSAACLVFLAVCGSGCGFHGKVGVVCWLTGGMFISLALG